MFRHSTVEASQSLDPPLAYPGATPDADRARKPPLPDLPYAPYKEKPEQVEPPYEPYKHI
jgi:hypothetical protein